MDDSPKHRGVEATVVDVDPSAQPIESIVVGDKRDTLGKRLGLLGLIILLMFFAIGSYIQSSKNGAQLSRAAKDRSGLIHTLNAQTDLIQQLQDAIAKQNQELKAAGLAVVVIPSSRTSTRYLPTPTPEPQPKPNSSSSTAKPKPRPRPSPSHSPSPTPDPIQSAKDLICAKTGICAFALTFFSIFF